jgi:hypothetical protein
VEAREGAALVGRFFSEGGLNENFFRRGGRILEDSSRSLSELAGGGSSSSLS